MEQHATEEATLAATVRAAIIESLGSIRAGSIQAGIPLTTLDRRLRGDGSDFTVAELKRLAAATGRSTSDFGVGAE